MLNIVDRLLATGAHRVSCPYNRVLLLAPGRAEELFHERAVQVHRRLDDPVPGYADDSAIVIVVGSAGDTGSLTVPLHDGQDALGGDPQHVGPNRLLENVSQAFVGSFEKLALAVIFTRQRVLTGDGPVDIVGYVVEELL
jgi:hypothetical protein